MGAVGILIQGLSTTGLAGDCETTRKVQKGESLSIIVQKYIRSNHLKYRIYGSNGMLRKVLEINQISIEKQDFILAGSKIKLPAELSSDANCRAANPETPEQNSIAPTNTPAPDATTSTATEPTTSPEPTPMDSAPPAQEPTPENTPADTQTPPPPSN